MLVPLYYKVVENMNKAFAWLQYINIHIILTFKLKFN
jgi:hypothetical protein